MAQKSAFWKAFQICSWTTAEKVPFHHWGNKLLKQTDHYAVGLNAKVAQLPLSKSSPNGSYGPHCKDTIPKIRNKYSPEGIVSLVPISTVMCLWAIYPRIGLPILLQKNIWTDPGITEIANRLRPSNSFSGNIQIRFSLQWKKVTFQLKKVLFLRVHTIYSRCGNKIVTAKDKLWREVICVPERMGAVGSCVHN